MFATPALRAQELKVQPTPLSTLLDFEKLDAANRSYPIWLDSVHVERKKNEDGSIAKTTFRIRVRRMEALNSDVSLRLFFDDEKDRSPVVSAWSETGVNQFPAESVGSGIGLPTSETVAISMKDVDYLEIEVPADGANLHSALISSLKTSEVKHAVDFDAPAPVSDPFSSGAPAQPSADDTLLYGRVKATLDHAVTKLSPETGSSAEYVFTLETQPLLAVVTFEILNADISAAPEIFVNDHSAGTAALSLPDLADPGFKGSVFARTNDMQFRYHGWIKSQKIVPGSLLHAGANKIVLHTPERSGAVAVRAVEVQLKYTSENFDYTLVP